MGAIFTAIYDVTSMILVLFAAGWILWQIVDDIRPETKFVKNVFKRLNGQKVKTTNAEGDVTKIEYIKGKVTPDEMALAGKGAIALAIIFGSVFIATVLFFGMTVIALNLPHPEGWSLF